MLRPVVGQNSFVGIPMAGMLPPAVPSGPRSFRSRPTPDEMHTAGGGGTFTTSRLPDETLKALTEARKGYQVELYRKKIDERAVHLALASELHLGFGSTIERGKKLLEHFQVVGLEGVDTSQSVAHRVHGVFLRMFGRIISLVSRITMGRVRDSIIHEIRENARTTDTSYLTIELEENHTPDVYEKAALTFWASALSMVSVGLALKCIPLSSDIFETFHTIFTPILTIMLSSVVIASGLSFLEPRIPRRYNKSTLFKWLTAPLSGFGSARDRTMVRNVVKAFSDNPDKDRLLVFCGRNHLPGMREILTNEYGFERVMIS